MALPCETGVTGTTTACVTTRVGTALGGFPCFFHRRLNVRQNLPRFLEKYFSGRRQPHGFRAALQQLKTDFVLEVADLAADARLRDVQLQRRARNVFRLGHGDEVTEMA